MLADLVRHLEAGGPTPRVVGLVLRGELRLIPVGAQPTVSAMASVDWPEHGPVRDGLPVMHYRLRVKRPASPLSAELRTDSPNEAARFLLQAIRP